MYLTRRTKCDVACLFFVCVFKMGDSKTSNSPENKWIAENQGIAYERENTHTKHGIVMASC